MNKLGLESSNILKNIINLELVKAKEQLEELTALVNVEHFELGPPPDYTLYQRLFLSFIMDGLNQAAEEMADNDGSGDSKVPA